MGYEPVERPGSPGSHAANITITVIAVTKSHIDCFFVELKSLPVAPSGYARPLCLLNLFCTITGKNCLRCTCPLFWTIYIDTNEALGNPFVI